MCLSEYYMVKKFLENREYFDMPGNIFILAIIYCIALFSVRIMLQQSQKTTVTREYVSNVVSKVGGAGGKTWNFVFRLLKQIFFFQNPDLIQSILIQKVVIKTCHEKMPFRIQRSSLIFYQPMAKHL